MPTALEHDLGVAEERIEGYAQSIALRSYRPLVQRRAMPLVLYFHGGRFNGGSLADAAIPAAAIAHAAGAWVVAVGYSLAPAFPFPAALEDGYRALQWAVSHAAAHGADASRIGLAGHDAGGNLATCIAAMARDRREVRISAQALIAPLLDPSLTHQVNSGAHYDSTIADALDMSAYASCYRAYLPNPMQRLHPYAAPLDSRRLAGLPPTLIASAEYDQLHVEADKYAAVLIAAGIPTEVTRHRHASHDAIANDAAVLADVGAFFKKRLAKAQRAA
ncbi:alpha/beta hydrolase [Rugamonas sp.]|uniref:alpha/beta hydrolase n=1 Tax=Rugamonas sp. TaxID=1926287 RepID=UPI0025D6889F|nr:alpha/beta hydrolase [Rugamonas sp.]